MKIDILKEVIKNEVYPAFGCTEPIAVAYACANASVLFKKYKPFKITAEITLDPATYKNGYAVSLPNIKNARGNLIAAAIGIIKRKPELKNRIFANISEAELKEAQKIIEENRVKINADYTKKDFYIEASLKQDDENAVCIITNGHFNISFLAINGKVIKRASVKKMLYNYREIIKDMTLDDIVKMAEKADNKILNYIEEGVKINLHASKEGKKARKLSFFLNKLKKKSFFKTDMISKIQQICTSATDARMSGADIPVMSSGQSGNQGVVAILVPYLVGKELKIKKEKILKSIIISHLINSYIKAYTGELSAMCGCSIASGAAASAAIVYMIKKDTNLMEKAINNVLADIGGIICDGAKESCSLKVATAVETSIRSAFLTLEGYSVDTSNGFLANTLKETISNTAKISVSGMSYVDWLTIEIMKHKNSSNV